MLTSSSGQGLDPVQKPNSTLPSDPRPDLLLLTNALHAAWNAQDLERVMAFFSDDAVIVVTPAQPGTSGTYSGKEQIREMVERNLPGMYIEATDHRVEGNKVSWHVVASNDRLWRMRQSPIVAHVQAVFEGEKIKSLTVTLRGEDSESMAS